MAVKLLVKLPATSLWPCYVRAYQKYKSTWSPTLGETLRLTAELTNPQDSFTMAVIKDSYVVRHVQKTVIKNSYVVGHVPKTVIKESYVVGHVLDNLLFPRKGWEHRLLRRK